MSSAHLHAVPDPGPDDETSESGQWPTPVPVPAVVAARPPTDDDDQEQPAEDVDEDLVDEEDAADVDEDLVDVDDEQPRGLGRLRPYRTDLRPYIDPRPLAELGPLAVQVGKHGGPPLFRAAWAGLRFVGRGIGVLLAIFAGYLSGKIGTRGSIGARFCAAGFAAYAMVKLSAEYPAFPWFVLALLLAAVVLAGLGRIKVPEDKPAKKAVAKKKAEGKKGAPAGKTATKKDEAGEADDAPADEPKQAAPAPPRKGLLGRLRRRPDSPADPADDPAEDDEEGASEEADEDAGDAPAEAPRDPSREALIGALHHLYRGGSGVLHTALVQHLGLADSRAAKRALDGAGIAYRPGVRTPAGNGPGVHHDDIPPLPPAQGSPQGSVVAGQPANANANNAANAPEEGSGVEGTVWTSAELAQGYRWVQDPTKPAAWSIEYRAEN
jgi:hypothetical protein